MRSMKRNTAVFLVVAMFFALTGCGASSGEAEKQESVVTAENTETTGNEDVKNSVTEIPTQAQERTETYEPETDSNDILVVYFSRTGEQYTVGVIDKGNTAIVAEMIAEETGADTFEILPQEDYYPYTYDALTDVAKKEQNENARPAYQGTVPDLSAYSTVFIGAPVWWGDWPMICYTFFEDNADALSGKTLIPFSTHEGSGLSGFDRKLSAVISDAEVLDGLAIRGNDAKNDKDKVREAVKDWLSDLK